MIVRFINSGDEKFRVDMDVEMDFIPRPGEVVKADWSPHKKEWRVQRVTWTFEEDQNPTVTVLIS